jgi:hypothetical protein
MLDDPCPRISKKEMGYHITDAAKDYHEDHRSQQHYHDLHSKTDNGHKLFLPGWCDKGHQNILFSCRSDSSINLFSGKHPTHSERYFSIILASRSTNF